MDILAEAKFAGKQIGYGLVVFGIGAWFLVDYGLAWASGEHDSIGDRFEVMDVRYAKSEDNRALRSAKRDYFHIARERRASPSDEWVNSRYQEVLSDLNEAQRALGIQETAQE